MTQFTNPTDATPQEIPDLSTLLSAISQLSGQINSLSSNQDRLQQQIDVLTTPTPPPSVPIQTPLNQTPTQTTAGNSIVSAGPPKVKLPEKFKENAINSAVSLIN